MKQLLITMIALAIFAVGCSKGSAPEAPSTTDKSPEEIQKLRQQQIEAQQQRQEDGK